MLGWLKLKLKSRLPGEMSITSDMQMIPPLWQKVKSKGERKRYTQLNAEFKRIAKRDKEAF